MVTINECFSNLKLFSVFNINPKLLWKQHYTVLTNAYYLEQISKDVIERTLSINQVFHNPVSHTYYVFFVCSARSK